MRLTEVWVHLVDLDAGFTFADIPAHHLEPLVAEVVSPHADRPDWPTVRLTVELPDGRERVWHLGGHDDQAHEVTGAAADVLAWLSGRGDGTTLRGVVPELPAWG
jgi:maleylpyruvate isomerase